MKIYAQIDNENKIIILKQNMNTELLKRLIRNEFDLSHEFYSDLPYDLIKLAKDLNLNELANEMESDL